jgi:hypothetical protein
MFIGEAAEQSTQPSLCAVSSAVHEAPVAHSGGALWNLLRFGTLDGAGFSRLPTVCCCGGVAAFSLFITIQLVPELG